LSDAGDSGRTSPEFCPSPGLVRDQLSRVLASKQFRSSELQKQFLTFVVDRTLAGRSDEIKEYAIGADAFGRGQDFDPRIDSVVRVVARRVRERLAEYFTQGGRTDSVAIRLAPGSYIPSFVARQEPEASVAPPPSPERHSPPGSGSLLGLTISHYEVLELIAQGSSGLIYGYHLRSMC
jgi:hypothetical protein